MFCNHAKGGGERGRRAWAPCVSMGNCVMSIVLGRHVVVCTHALPRTEAPAPSPSSRDPTTKPNRPEPPRRLDRSIVHEKHCNHKPHKVRGVYPAQIQQADTGLMRTLETGSGT